MIQYTVFVGRGNGKREFYAKELTSFLNAMAAVYLVTAEATANWEAIDPMYRGGDAPSLKWRIAWSVDGGPAVTVAKGVSADAVGYAFAVTPEVKQAFDALFAARDAKGSAASAEMGAYMAAVMTMKGCYAGI